ncbi:serine-rich adhesin for platelets-like [Periplaneta americana]|uniref:serine-rich adhesin for platelets-like n=1 Tax=Periplaneta americana TaxID=6978 RepID=UPI0037E79F46
MGILIKFVEASCLIALLSTKIILALDSNTPQNVHASTENTSVINSNDSELKELYSRGKEQSMNAKMHQLSVQESSTGKLEEKNKSVSAVPVITTEKMEPEYKSDGNAAAYMEGGGKAKLQDDSTQIGTNKTELQTSSTVLPIGTKKHNNSEESLNDSLSNTDHDIRNSSVVPRKGVDITNNELGLETTSTIRPSEKATQNNSQGSLNDSFSNTDHDFRNSSVVPRKGVYNKIVPRKGVESTFPESTSTSSQESTEENVEEEGNATISMKNDTSTTLSVNLLPSDTATPGLVNATVNHSIGNISSLLNTTATSPVPPKRNKPQVTLDVGNDSPANLSTQQLLSHSKDSNKSDYIVPIVGIILAVPLVIVLIVVLYKKGSEFWERRHYRRMDFLIDGMYND